MWGSVHENSEPTLVVDTMPSLHTETRQGCGGARSETDSGTERQGHSLGLLPQKIIGERSMLKAAHRPCLTLAPVLTRRLGTRITSSLQTSVFSSVKRA